MSVDAATWRNRIVRSGDAALAEITANPANWRTHPKRQADALAGVLGSVGYVQQVVINARSGRLVDGHLRVELAERHGETSGPAVWVDLDDDEERLILATFDPLGALAGRASAQLSALLATVAPSDDALRAMLDGLAQDAGLLAPIDPLDEWQGMPAFEQEDKTALHTILVHFDSLDDVSAFGDMVQQAVSESTKFIWFPKKARESASMAFDES